MSETRILDNVTLCAVDGVNPNLAIRAINICQKGIQFAESILFSSQPGDTEQALRERLFYTGQPDSYRHVHVPQLAELAAYTPFYMKEVGDYIKTPFALFVHWDGYIVNPGAWTDEFLEYDYIGAPWHWHLANERVGNGGFSLRSKKLLNALKDPQFVADGAEDDITCRKYRPILERQYGVRFAPEAIAARFAYECSLPMSPTFGFHGIFNLRREVSNVDLAWMIGQPMPPGLQQRLRCL